MKKKYFRQTNDEGGHQYQTCLIRVVKRSSFTTNKMAKIHKTLSKVTSRTRKLQLFIRIGFKTLFYSIKVKEKE